MDRLDVINRALLKVALPLAASLDDCDWHANFVFENCSEEVLRAHNWGFAMRYEVLERLAIPPAFGFSHAYQMPPDCVRVTDVRPGSDLRSPKARFVTQGRKVLSNAAPCNCRYVGKDLDPDNWPPDFLNVVACRIACEIAALSAEKIQLVPQLMQIYQAALYQAIAQDAHEETERVPLDDSIIQARAGD